MAFFVILSFFVPGLLEARTLFGPADFSRGLVLPDYFKEAFINCEPEASYELHVQNGLEDSSKRLSSVRIHLNGEEVLSRNELNQNVGVIKKPVKVKKENTLKIRLAGLRRGQITVSINCLENCFGINILSPKDHSTLKLGGVLVSGTVPNAEEDTRVKVNDRTAGVNEGKFAAPDVSVGIGKNTIIAQTVNTCGQVAEDSITVNVLEGEKGTLLTANPKTGLPPLSVSLRATAGIPQPVVNYQWDFDGDGSFETSGASLSEISTSYNHKGLYFPTVLITDKLGNQYTETTAVNVYSFEKTHALIMETWEGMRDALRNSDIPGALAFFAGPSKKRFRKSFLLMEDSLPQMAEDLGTPNFVSFVETGALYEMRVIQDGEEFSYHVEFIKDENGVWKIGFF